MHILVIGPAADSADRFGPIFDLLRVSVVPHYLDDQAATEATNQLEADLAILAAAGPDAPRWVHWLRTRYPRASILVVSQAGQAAQRKADLEAGADDCLISPFDAFEAAARIQNLLSLNEATRKLSQAEMQLTDLQTDAAAMEQEIAFRLTKVANFCDPVTGSHLLRMPHYAKHISKNLGMSESEQDLLLRAAPLHDLGAISIPVEIMAKGSPLTESELQVMQHHATMGYELLKDSNTQLLQAGAVIALSHHENFDGSGYPQGLAGEDIPLLGRIVAVADTFDDYHTGRPYRAAWDLATTRFFIESQSGKMFDPLCVEAFFQDWEGVQRIADMF